MSQDQDPIDATRSFEPVDPYNIPPEQAGATMPGYGGHQPGYEPGYEQQHYAAPDPAHQPGFKQRLTRLGPLKLALLGTAGVIVLGGAAWGTTAAFQSGSSSSNTAASASATGDTAGQAPGAGATSGAHTGTGKHKNGKAVRLKVSEAEAGTIWGTDAQGRKVTVTYDASTKFGTKKMPLNPQNIDPGKEIAVTGTRTGDKIAATSVVFVNPRQPKEGTGPASGRTAPPPTTASPTDPASPVGGGA